MPAATAQIAAARRANGARPRFGERMDEILRHAADVFCEKGYEGASMRDLSRATKMSLAGLYYYFESKEKLLYLIQKHTFSTILAHLHERLEGVRDPEDRLRVFIQNHLQYFLANRKAMKVLSHESDALKGEFGEEIRAIKREYFRTCVDLVAGVMRRGKAAGVQSSRREELRIAALSLFGMMNWIYTWYNPRVDADATVLAGQMSKIFLNGVLCGAHASATKRRKPASRRKP
ncbi:MAG: TetR/AcrR family transcriptional regulator [Acidobacteriia bacterium]|nr:TetR/AcrR family transcriptional regulator [Terriglobia bacterium]